MTNDYYVVYVSCSYIFGIVYVSLYTIHDNDNLVLTSHTLLQIIVIVIDLQYCHLVV